MTLKQISSSWKRGEIEPMTFDQWWKTEGKSVKGRKAASKAAWRAAMEKTGRPAKTAHTPEGFQVVINCDGACEPNPGQCSYGFVARLPTGKLVHQQAAALGEGTNNIGEWQAVIRAMQWAQTQGYGHIHIKTDSMLVVKQINGRWKAHKEHIRKLCEHGISLRKHFPTCQVVHVPREQNTEADALAGRAMGRIV